MRLTITIDTDNAAFDSTPESEVARILQNFAAKIQVYGIDETGYALRDDNGNRIGRVDVDTWHENGDNGDTVGQAKITKGRR